MTPEEIIQHQNERRGRYGAIVEGQEVLSVTPLPSPSWRYADNYVLDIKGR